MKLLQEIIDLAIDDSTQLATLLRKCLVLSHEIKNDYLKNWATQELNGYVTGDEVPPYRQIPAVAKGILLGGWGAQINNQPLPPSVLDKEHRHWAETARLSQPVASYEAFVKESQGKMASIEWPPAMTAHYQSKFIEGYALNRAWQEIPRSAFIALTDNVRNKVLQLALEIRDELGIVQDNPKELDKGKMERLVVNIINGGNNIIAENVSNVGQIGDINIQIGNLDNLNHALSSIGVPQSQITELATVLDADQKELDTESPKTIGKRTSDWIVKAATGVGKAGGKITVEAATSLATKFVSQYLGIA